MLRYLFVETKAEYTFYLFRELLGCRDSFDLVISISYPLYVHLAFSLARLFRPNLARVAVADCGDPYFFHEVIRRAPYHRRLEDFALRPFDFVTVPTAEASDAYTAYKPKGSIRVIAQGFRLTEAPRAQYRPHAIPTFGYAGSFQPVVRDPSELLNYLASRKQPFEFRVYMTKPSITMSFLRHYQAPLGDRLNIYGTKDRQELLHELSQLDFLVNVGNTTANQLPSKLIDYALVGRPVFSYTPGQFSPTEFEEFLNGDYSEAQQIDISRHDITQVARKFEALQEEATRVSDRHSPTDTGDGRTQAN